MQPIVHFIIYHFLTIYSTTSMQNISMWHWLHKQRHRQTDTQTWAAKKSSTYQETWSFIISHKSLPLGPIISQINPTHKHAESLFYLAHIRSLPVSLVITLNVAHSAAAWYWRLPGMPRSISSCHIKYTTGGSHIAVRCSAKNTRSYMKRILRTGTFMTFILEKQTPHF